MCRAFSPFPCHLIGGVPEAQRVLVHARVWSQDVARALPGTVRDIPDLDLSHQPRSRCGLVSGMAKRRSVAGDEAPRRDYTEPRRG